MKNSRIHKGFAHNYLRDFLANEICKNLNLDLGLHLEDQPPMQRNGAVDYLIKNYEAQIMYWQKKIEVLQNIKAVEHFIKIKGWQQFDVSNETEMDLPYAMCASFIGTVAEHKTLLQKIKSAKK